jgi:hypothetical protein
MLVQAEKIKNLLSINLDLDKFYAIRIYSSQIQLQGEARKCTILECESAGYVFQYIGGYLESKKGLVEITLTF